MRKRTGKAVFVAALVMALVFAASCAQKKNPLANTMWKFVYEEGDYVVFSFSDFYFLFTDYRVNEGGKADYYEVTGSYEIKGKNLVIKGENGKILMDGEMITNSSLKRGWDGEYEFAVLSDALVLTRGDSSVRLQKSR